MPDHSRRWRLSVRQTTAPSTDLPAGAPRGGRQGGSAHTASARGTRSSERTGAQHPGRSGSHNGSSESEPPDESPVRRVSRLIRCDEGVSHGASEPRRCSDRQAGVRAFDESVWKRSGPSRPAGARVTVFAGGLVPFRCDSWSRAGSPQARCTSGAASMRQRRRPAAVDSPDIFCCSIRSAHCRAESVRLTASPPMEKPSACTLTQHALLRAHTAETGDLDRGRLVRFQVTRKEFVPRQSGPHPGAPSPRPSPGGRGGQTVSGRRREREGDRWWPVPAGILEEKRESGVSFWCFVPFVVPVPLFGLVACCRFGADVENHEQSLPLPLGEGWGEGGCVSAANTSFPAVFAMAASTGSASSSTSL